MIEPDALAFDLVVALELVGFVKVAGAAGQCTVRFLVRAAPRGWNDMLDLEWKVENRLGRPAVFTAVPGTLGHVPLKRAHGASS
jgi:hypothetical protein